MVKKNFKIKLHNGHVICTNIAFHAHDIKPQIYHFIGSLSRSKDVADQITIINNLTHYRGYSSDADEVYVCNTISDIVTVRKHIYDNKTNTFRMGNIVDMFNVKD